VKGRKTGPCRGWKEGIKDGVKNERKDEGGIRVKVRKRRQFKVLKEGGQENVKIERKEDRTEQRLKGRKTGRCKGWKEKDRRFKE